MRIDLDACRDPDLLAAEVRRLQAVIESGQPTLTALQRDVIECGVMLCDATAGMANDRATIDGASSAADVLRGLLGRDDTNERSVASAGSHPVSGGPITLRLSNKQQEMLSRLPGRQSGTLVPLDLPQPTLTDEERDVLDRLAHDAAHRRMVWTERVLRGVLSRLG
jgi:hypothetical protein